MMLVACVTTHAKLAAAVLLLLSPVASVVAMKPMEAPGHSAAQTNATAIIATPALRGHASAVLAGLQTLAHRYEEGLGARLGTRDSLLSLLINIVILVIIVLVGLFLLWGGNVNQLRSDPVGSLRQTAERAEKIVEEGMNNPPPPQNKKLCC
mmetsp:Transcript_106823/g.276133  ORF Transcript_106823/g.276133 Transcript_106823/m.276133 type:complete len:152 (+) Transcript_106823:47-502(+)